MIKAALAMKNNKVKGMSQEREERDEEGKDYQPDSRSQF